MEKSLFILILILGLISCNQKDLDISKGWVFKKGDNPEWSKTDYSDSSWQSIRVNEGWESQGYPGNDEFGWYRLKLVIPSSLKKAAEQSGIHAIAINLGHIDDADQTFLNGQLIGKTSGMPQDYLPDMEGWLVSRRYIISTDDKLIQWDKENVIAVRVFDYSSNGGMTGGPYSISLCSFKDAVSVRPSTEFITIADSAATISDSINIEMKVPGDEISGTLKMEIKHKPSNQTTFEKTEKIRLKSNQLVSVPLSFPLKSFGTYTGHFQFISDAGDTSKWENFILYAGKPRISGNHFVTPKVKDAIENVCSPFRYENVKLEGYLQQRLDANLHKRLLNVNENELLKNFAFRPGIQTFIVEHMGKYLDAATRMWRYSHDEKLKIQLDRMADMLIACQDSDGYLGTYLPQDHWTEWDVWGHKYDMAGLLQYYSNTGYEPALNTAKRIGDLICKTFGPGEGQRDINIGPSRGMANTSIIEPMTDLYRYTGDKKYLDFCHYIIKAYDQEDGPKILTSLLTVGTVNKVSNGKAYEMLSNLWGILKLYKLTGEKELLKACETAWNDIAYKRNYITGSSSSFELFHDDDHFPAGSDANICEGCVTTTWLQFSKALYLLTGEVKYPEQIEKTIYNHLLAAQNPENGHGCYYTPLQGRKPFSSTVSCCLSSVPRGISLIPELVYTKNQNGFCINIYSPGSFKDSITSANGKIVPVETSIITDFPAAGEVDIKMNLKEPSEFNIAFRVPEWSKDFELTFRSEKINGTPGNIINIQKRWDKNTSIRVKFDLNLLALPGGKSYPDCIALQYGPQILSIDGSINSHFEDITKLSFDAAKLSFIPVNSMLPEGWVGSQQYQVSGNENGKLVKVTLVPYADASQKGSLGIVWMKGK